MALSWVGGHIPWNPVQCSPASPLLPFCATSVPPPLFIMWCWGGGYLIPPTATSCHSWDTMGGGGWPPPQLSRCPACSGAGIVRRYPSVSPPSPYTPRLGSPAAPPLLESKSDTSVVIPQRGDLPLRSQSNTILCLTVGRKQPCCQVWSTVWALNPQPLMYPVGEAF